MAVAIGHHEKVRALAATSRLLAIGGVRAGSASRITVFDHAASKTLFAIDVPAHVLALAWAGDQLAAACSDGTLRLFREKSEVRRFEAHKGGCHAIALAGPDRLATAGADGTARIWSVTTGEKQKEWALSARPLRAIAIDPDGEFLAAAGDDGVVRSIQLSNGETREMKGHDAPVRALAFTPRDGRLASAGDDGAIRLWYLVGEIEFETRGADDSGHAGGVLALLFPPTPPVQPDGAEPGDRLYSAGADGKIKVWRLGDRRKPRTLDCGEKPVAALAFVPAASPEIARTKLGAITGAGDRRTVWRWELDGAGNPAENPTAWGHGFDVLGSTLAGGQRPAREAAVKELAALEEPEALELLVKALAGDKEPPVRALVAAELGANGRRTAKPALRTSLDDAHPSVRAAALDALLALDKGSPLSALRAALDSKFPEIRGRALGELPPLRESSPLVPGLIADKLKDADAGVRLIALDQLQRLHPARSAEPLRIAVERGPADVRAEALIRGAFAGLSADAEYRSILQRSLDDADATVRRDAFALMVADRRPLAATLEPRDEELGRTLGEIARRGAQLRRPKAAGTPAPAEPTADELAAARAALPASGAAGAPAEEDLQPLLTAMACRTPDTALRGARGLAALGDVRALGALLQLSRESDAPLRRESAVSLQSLQDTRAKKRLVWMLDDPDAAVRAAALGSLMALEPDRPLVSAESALRASQEDVRVRGLDALVKAGAGNEQAEQLLGDALEDESPKVRAEAFRTLWSWHTADPVKALDRALAARFPDLRLRAVAELKARGKEPWAMERLRKSIADRDAGVAKAAYDAVVEVAGKTDAAAHIAAMGSQHTIVKAAGAKGGLDAPASAEELRSPLMKLLQDEEPAAHIQAVDTLDKLFPGENGPLYAALQSGFWVLKIHAAELLAIRHDEQLIDAMRAFLLDKELRRILPPPVLAELRTRAASTLATLGSPRTAKWLGTELIKDEAPSVREQAARGVANGARRGDEGLLLDLLAHADAWVRSWASDGLSRLGDARALPVLVGNLKHEHQPIRLGAILSFAALGPEGFSGMLKGLEDPTRDVQEMVFAIVLARDLRAFRRGEAPELLAGALASQRADIRFAAARALELRTEPEGYLEHLIAVLLPPRPEKAADMKEWPPEEERERIAVGLADALASDRPETRYAAAQVLMLSRKPLEFFREARNVGGLRSSERPPVPDNTPRGPAATDTAVKGPRLRRLFSDFAPEPSRTVAAPQLPQEDKDRLRRLAFGAYVGLLRQVGAQDEETNRVRRDACDRIVELFLQKVAGATAALPPLQRALDDPNHLVRRSALAGLERMFPSDPEVALSLALSSTADDIARAALDELAARGQGAVPRIAAALDSSIPEVRRYAFELLEKLSPKGSLDPLIAAMSSQHGDLRLGVVERLASSGDPRVVSALSRAMESDHEDLRLRAAELLAIRKDDRPVSVLATFLRSENAALAERAKEALVGLASPAAILALAAWLDEAPKEKRAELVEALGNTRKREAMAPVTARLDDEDESLRAQAFDSAMEIAGPERAEKIEGYPDPDESKKRTRDAALALELLKVAVRSRDAGIRARAAAELDYGDDPAANDLLLPLFADRDVEVRKAAVASYAERVKEKGAPVAPLEDVLRAGAREVMLAAAEAVGAKGGGAAFRPLLLYVRAGEGEERPRALLALGALGDPRALEELETIAGGGTEEAPADAEMQAAAVEALGALAPKIPDPERRKKVLDRLERDAQDGAGGIRVAAVRALGRLGGAGGERFRTRLEQIAVDGEAPSEARTEAASQLGKIADPASEAALARALEDEDDDLRAAARKALEKTFPRDRARVELLSTRSEYDDVSEPAVAWLTAQGDPATLVAQLPEIKSVELRRRVRLGLVRRKAMPVPALTRLLEHDDPAFREDAAAIIGAGTIADGDRVMLGGALAAAERRSAAAWTSKSGEAREAEAKAWRELVWAATIAGARAVAPSAHQLVSSGERAAPAEVRREAARALAVIGSAADVEALVDALGDVDPGVRTAAAGSLAKLSPDRTPPLTAQGRPVDPLSFGVSPEKIADRRGLTGSPEAWRLLLPARIAAGDAAALIEVARSGTEEAVRLDAIDGLGRVGGEQAMGYLQSIALPSGPEKSEPVRKAAWRALRRAKRAEKRAS